MNGAQRVLLFGGAFDPPHKGHFNLLCNGVAAVQPDGVLVIPTGVAPHKQASATPWALRAEMCRCFEPVFSNLLISDVENTGDKNYTCDTLRRLRRQQPQTDFYLAVGGDMLEGFQNWKNWQQILKMATLVALARYPKEEEAMLRAKAQLEAAGGKVILVPGDVVPISSHEIRQALAAGQGEAMQYVLPPADRIIRENHLYEASAENKSGPKAAPVAEASV